MKRLLIALLMMTLVFSVAEGRKKGDKSGEVAGNTYIDGTYPFKLTFNDAWKYTMKKGEDKIRLILTQKKYDIPPAYTHAPNYTTVPKITVMVDTTSLSLDMFVDSLLSNAYKSDQKKAITSEFPILFGDYQVRKRFKLPAGASEGIQVLAQLQYTISVQGSGSGSDRGEIVTDFYGGSIFFAKKDNNIYMLHFIGEWRYFDSLQKDFAEVIKGFEFTE
jgi:hypothetical protein